MKTNTGVSVAFVDNGEESRGKVLANGGNGPSCSRERDERFSAGRANSPVMPLVRDNRSSFENLVRRLSPTLKRITCKLNILSSFVDDQDLFQEALVHLWTNFSSGALSDKTDSYMLQGCYFHLRNYLRKNQEQAVLISLGHPADEDDPRAEDIPDVRSLHSFDEAEGNLQIGAMEEGGITEREKNVLLFSLEGMTTREIGKQLGISHVSVVKIRNRIKERYASLNG